MKKKKEMLELMRSIQKQLIELKFEIKDVQSKDAIDPAFQLDEETLSLRLCYIDSHDGGAWFTSCDLDKQWGDDWNDAPYEHNAGEPYRDHYPVESEKKRVSHRLFKVYWESKDYKTPKDGFLNSPWSVERINAQLLPWLIPVDGAGAHVKPVVAGTTLREFLKFVEESEGGIVFIPREFQKSPK